jgi:hypothetical protein
MDFKLFRGGVRGHRAPAPEPPPEPGGEDELALEEGVARGELPPLHPGVPPVVVPRWVQLVLLPIALLALWALARAAGTVLLVLVIAGVIALILNPLV